MDDRLTGSLHGGRDGLDGLKIKVLGLGATRMDGAAGRLENFPVIGLVWPVCGEFPTLNGTGQAAGRPPSRLPGKGRTGGPQPRARAGLRLRFRLAGFDPGLEVLDHVAQQRVLKVTKRLAWTVKDVPPGHRLLIKRYLVYESENGITSLALSGDSPRVLPSRHGRAVPQRKVVGGVSAHNCAVKPFYLNFIFVILRQSGGCSDRSGGQSGWK